jgi:hypothetical protein
MKSRHACIRQYLSIGCIRNQFAAVPCGVGKTCTAFPLKPLKTRLFIWHVPARITLPVVWSLSAPLSVVQAKAMDVRTAYLVFMRGDSPKRAVPTDAANPDQWTLRSFVMRRSSDCLWHSAAVARVNFAIKNLPQRSVVIGPESLGQSEVTGTCASACSIRMPRCTRCNPHYRCRSSRLSRSASSQW